MSLAHGASIVTSGLVFMVDPANLKSYPGTGTMWTDIINNSVGTMVGTPTYSSNNAGTFLFSGVTQNFNFSTSPALNITNNITLEAWVNITSNVNYGGILVYGTLSAEQYSLNTMSTGQFSVGTNYPTNWYLNSMSSYSLSNWYHLVVTFSSTVWNMYLNGVFNSTSTIPISTFPSVTSAYLTIGDNQPGGQEYLNGNVGAARIYNRVLANNEIAQNFNALRGRYGI